MPKSRRLASRIELAAYLAVGALDHAFDAAHGTGNAENTDQLFEMAADLIIRRARELYARAGRRGLMKTRL